MHFIGFLPPFLSHFTLPTSSLSFFRITSQINYIYTSLCLRVCFWGTPDFKVCQGFCPWLKPHSVASSTLLHESTPFLELSSFMNSSTDGPLPLSLLSVSEFLLCCLLSRYWHKKGLKRHISLLIWPFSVKAICPSSPSWNPPHGSLFHAFVCLYLCLEFYSYLTDRLYFFLQICPNVITLSLFKQFILMSSLSVSFI